MFVIIWVVARSHLGGLVSLITLLRHSEDDFQADLVLQLFNKTSYM